VLPVGETFHLLFVIQRGPEEDIEAPGTPNTQSAKYSDKELLQQLLKIHTKL
jgi:hypothetical protein